MNENDRLTLLQALSDAISDRESYLSSFTHRHDGSLLKDPYWFDAIKRTKDQLKRYQALQEKLRKGLI